MKIWLSRGMFALLVLALTLATLFYGAVVYGGYKMTRPIDVQAASMKVETSVNISHGKYLFMTHGCAGCHGVDGGGKVIIEDGGQLVSSTNLTRGTGGVVRGFESSDWVRAIRHGVKPNEQHILTIPSQHSRHLSNKDIASLVAFISALTPVVGDKSEAHY